MAINNTPHEDEEQIDFVDWLERNDLKFTAIPNSTYTKSWSQKRKNHAVGLRKGFPDMLVLVPPERSKHGIGHLLCIEMKRVKGGVTSREQKGWQDALNGLLSSNVSAFVANGADEAKMIVSEHATLVDNSDIF